jgi:hypothetical protein
VGAGGRNRANQSTAGGCICNELAVSPFPKRGVAWESGQMRILMSVSCKKGERSITTMPPYNASELHRCG